MLLALGIIIFVIGCCLSSYEDKSYNEQVRLEQRHKELIRALSELQKNSVAPRKIKQVRRRLAVDREGNLLGEEITEEVVEDNDL